ncbi:hypothetical protein DRE_07231 [Drechslerella stenobrocha 248]|uniref:4Fe-4S ferredoxin-type domain-containing protein n=1 Tax=Drechslerella stenobrocha 248 TaxID=1043628 RepID=W7HJI4_9PEZI|nr:hypothetical protein DRE_07231 [Drechslerella stenobrocha 248]
MKFAYTAAVLFAALAAAAPQRGHSPDEVSIRRAAPRPTPTRITTRVTYTTRIATSTKTTRPSTTTEKCDIILCADGVNECGIMYGGCFPACPGLPTPTFTPPPCPTTNKKCDTILCADMVNECGMMYGGCFEACPDSPTPTFAPPPCPSGWDRGHKPGKKILPVDT